MDNLLKTFFALSDETRVRIFAFIAKHKKVCVCDVENSFSMIQSRVSRHLKILKEGGFLKVSREGRWAYYSLVSEMDTMRKTIIEQIVKEVHTPKLVHNCKVDDGSCD